MPRPAERLPPPPRSLDRAQQAELTALTERALHRRRRNLTAAEISEHFTLDFLARLAAELDPRRAAEVVSAIATDTVVAVSAAMAAAGEHIAMGRFVAHLEEAALRRCIEALGDEDLLRVAFVMEGEERLPLVFEMIGAERTERMLAAGRANGLLEEAEHVLARLAGASEHGRS